MSIFRKSLSVFISTILITSLFVEPAKAATSLGTTTTDSTFEIATTTSQNLVINNVTDFNDLVITGFTGNVRVVVTASAGTVKLNTTTNLTLLTGYQTNIGDAAAAIGFSASVANANTALNDLRYIAAGTGGSGTIQVDVSSAGTGAIAYNAANGHYYEYVSTAVTWDAANTAIGTSESLDTCLKKFNGLCGYFANATSASENAFIVGKVGTSAAWLGGTDGETEGTWKWVGGPASEKNQTFWVGTSTGSAPIISGSTRWYANWNGGEPNNSGNEDALQILSGGGGEWNDLPTTGSTMGYVIEYGGLSSDAISETSVQRIIKFRTRIAQSALTVNSTTGNYQQPLTLTTTGGSGSGAVTWTLDAGGTATGCSLTDGVLSATSLGTCFVTATKAQDNTYLSISSSSTAVSFKTYVGITTTNAAAVTYNNEIVLNTELGTTSKIEARGFTGNVRAEAVATGGNVQITVTTGVTAVTGYQSPVGNAAASIAFEGSIANVNAALDSLKFIATASPTSGSVAITVSPISNSSIAYYSGNGHYYEFITTPVTWNAANTAIGTSETIGAGGCAYQFNGLCGYFATVTSSAENAFIVSKVGTASAWLGGTDSGTEGTWKWIGGPVGEKNTTFWLGGSGGSVQGGLYANWNSSEPNDSGSNEDALEILSGGSGKWNDLPTGSSTRGYVVEYGGLAGQTETLTVATRTVTVTIGRATQSALTVSTINATFGTPFTLSTSGGSGAGAVTYVIADGTATGCALDGSGKLVSTTAGTCTVTATKAQDTNYLVRSSAATTVTFWDNSIATPAAPSAEAGDSQATVTWIAVANAGTYTITSTPGNFTCTSTGTSCTVTGLSNNVSYTFTVQATNPLGATSSSSAPSATTTPRAPRVFAPIDPNTQNNQAKPVVEPPKPFGTGEPAKVSVGPNGETNTPLAPDSKFVPLTTKATDENAQVMVNGEVQSVSIKTVVPQGYVAIQGSNWNLNLSVRQGGEKVAPVNDAGNLLFVKGNNSSFEGRGFTPKSIFRVFVLSTPIFLGEFTTDEVGEISGRVQIPDSLRTGVHTLQFHNLTDKTFNKVISVGVKIVEKAKYKKSKKLKKKKAQNKLKVLVCWKGDQKVTLRATAPVCPKGFK